MKTVIDFSMTSGNLKVEADPIEIDLDPEKFVEGPAEAIAEVVKDAIEAQPGNRWNRTGHLKRGVRADGGGVSVPGDRLASADVAQRFADEVMPSDPTRDPRVVEAFEDSLDATIK